MSMDDFPMFKLDTTWSSPVYKTDTEWLWIQKESTLSPSKGWYILGNRGVPTDLYFETPEAAASYCLINGLLGE